MKHADLLVMFFILAFIGTFIPAHAYDEARRAAFVEKWDTDGDGDLRDSERAAFRTEREQRRNEYRLQFDTDGDGEISDAERSEMRARREQKRAELTQQFDADGDGKLNREERQTARSAGALKGDGHRGGQGRGKRGG